jgi:hypothetical protein
MEDQEYMRTTIVPKSDQLNADDLLTGPITVTITGVRRGSVEQPVIVDIEGYEGRPYKPGKSMRRVLISAYGDEPKQWIGKQLTLYCDPEVKFGGVKVGGIRISHMSGLANDMTFRLTVSRGRRCEFLVRALRADQYVQDARREIASAQTLPELDVIAAVLRGKPEPVRSALRPAYESRRKALKEARHDVNPGEERPAEDSDHDA